MALIKHIHTQLIPGSPFPSPLEPGYKARLRSTARAMPCLLSYISVGGGQAMAGALMTQTEEAK